MPKTSIDYSKTIIYKIEHIENEKLVYVGHTTCWDKRKCRHKSNCNNEGGTHYNLKLYQMIRDNEGWEMFNMIEVEKYPCADKNEAEKRENEVMKELKATMNTHRSYITNEELKELKQRSDKDYRRNNMNTIFLNKKNYRNENIEKIKEGNKKYYERNTETVNEKHKEYYDKNKDKLIKYANNYFEKNKEQIKEKRKEKIFCECGCEVNKTNLNRHQTSKKTYRFNQK
jgi:hypothetical protein